MEGTLPEFHFFEWISPGEQALFVWGVLILVGLLVAAVLIEVWRRRAGDKRRIETEWRTVDEIARRKGFSDEERNILRDAIARTSPRSPLRAVSEHEVLTECLTATGGADTASLPGRGLHTIRERLGLHHVPHSRSMTSTQEIDKGQLIWIAPAVASSADWLHARVSDVDDVHFSVTPCSEGTAPKHTLRPGDTVRCHLWREYDARYRFRTTVVRSDDAPPKWVLRHTRHLDRMQGREYNRIRVEQPVTVALLDMRKARVGPSLLDRPVVLRVQGRIVNLSGGGFAQIVHGAIPAGAVLRVILILPEEKPFQVHVRVIAAQPIAGRRRLLRCSFLDIDEESRERIVRYVAYRQQQLLEKAGEDNE